MESTAPSVERRLANLRLVLERAERGERDGRARPPDRGIPGRIGIAARVEELATLLDAEIVRSPAGTYLRIEREPCRLPVDRARLAVLPGQPPPEAPLVCLDTETTGLATAAGTLAFLIGLGWWEGDRFRQVQLLLPDHADEHAVLDELADRIERDAWLVTYNGRGFDWPLLVARFRLARRPAPPFAGHLDLLPLVRRLFRHRMVDARLGTVEGSLLGVRRHADVDGWEIPGRYLAFLRGGPAGPLVEVVRHNDEDVRSLARLLAHVEAGFGDPEAWARADPGDLAGLARAFARERRLGDALRCLDLALGAEAPARPLEAPAPRPMPGRPASRPPMAEDDWWSPRRRPDFGGAYGPERAPLSPAPLGTPWTEERLAIERAHLLRRLDRHADAAEAWDALAAGTSRISAVAAIELAKVLEHRLGDAGAALAAVDRARSILDRRRRLGRPEPRLEDDLVRRSLRLRRRLAGRSARVVPAPGRRADRTHEAGRSALVSPGRPA